MVVFILKFYSTLLCATGSSLVSYKFGSNFGQLFYDYSESGNHGQNGNSLYVDTSDTIPTDRGAYFSNSFGYIKLPPNNIQPNPLSLGIEFSIIMWLHTIDNINENHILYRISNDNATFLYLRRDPTFNRLFSIFNYPYR